MPPSFRFHALSPFSSARLSSRIDDLDNEMEKTLFTAIEGSGSDPGSDSNSCVSDKEKNPGKTSKPILMGNLMILDFLPRRLDWLYMTHKRQLEPLPEYMAGLYMVMELAPQEKEMMVDKAFFVAPSGSATMIAANVVESVLYFSSIQNGVPRERREVKEKDTIATRKVQKADGERLRSSGRSNRGTAQLRGLNSSYTIKDQQTYMDIKVLQGNRPLAKDCVELGMFGLEITPAPREVTKADVTFELDVNGILTVTAKERTPSAKSKSLTIIDYKGYLTEVEIERMTREAKMMAEEDQLAKARVVAMITLEQYIYNVKTAMKKPEIRNMMISCDKDRRVMESAVEEASRWLDENKNATKEDYDENMKKLMDVWNPIISNNGS
ncbi:Luminal-binding protein 2 (Fragment) [Linum perenne]